METVMDARAEFKGTVVQMIGSKSVSLAMLTNKGLTMQ